MKSWVEDFKELDAVLSTNSPIVKYRFNNFIGAPNYEYIHPVKQKKVFALTNALLADHLGSSITDIIVFGSSITLFCDSYSDIDMMVLGTFDHFSPQIELYKFGDVDLFGYNREIFLEEIHTNLFYHGIWTKGVRVYEQLPTASKGWLKIC